MDAAIAGVVTLSALAGGLYLAFAGGQGATVPRSAAAATKATVTEADGAMEFEYALTWGEAFEALRRRDGVFMSEFIAHLAGAPYVDSYLEMSPTARDSPFQFVILNARGALDKRAASVQEFAQYCTGAAVSTFQNIGRDAVLTIPCPHDGGVFGHLSQFCRTAPLELQKQLWSRVFQKAAGMAVPVYICTDGRSVPWLHVRIDSVPKYYKRNSWALRSTSTGPLPGDAGT